VTMRVKLAAIAGLLVLTCCSGEKEPDKLPRTDQDSVGLPAKWAGSFLLPAFDSISYWRDKEALLSAAGEHASDPYDTSCCHRLFNSWREFNDPGKFWSQIGKRMPDGHVLVSLEIGGGEAMTGYWAGAIVSAHDSIFAINSQRDGVTETLTVANLSLPRWRQVEDTLLRVYHILDVHSQFEKILDDPVFAVVSVNFDNQQNQFVTDCLIGHSGCEAADILQYLEKVFAVPRG
jgi:hypothetical protein